MAQPRLTDVVSNWNHLFEDMDQSTEDFYDRLEAALAKRNLPDAKYSRVQLAQGRLISGRRLYFRARRKIHTFDVCAAPFGNGFFVSWWLSEPKRWLLYVVIAILVLLGGGLMYQTLGTEATVLYGFVAIVVLILMLPRETYYTIDTRLMFQASVHAAVLEVLDEITKAKGVRALTEAERKPIMRDFVNKPKPGLGSLLRM